MGGAKTTAHMRSVSPSAIATRCQSGADPRGTRVVKTVRKTLETSRQTPTTLSPTAPTREAPSAPARSATALERSASKNQAPLARRGAARATTVRGVEYRAVPGTSKGKGRTSAVLGASHRASHRARDDGSIRSAFAPVGAPRARRALVPQSRCGGGALGPGGGERCRPTTAGGGAGTVYRAHGGSGTKLSRCLRRQSLLCL